MHKTLRMTAVLLAVSAFNAQAQTPPNLNTIITPDYVNLGNQQTRVKNQGLRRTCITFASIGALEAAYKKAGYGDLNLSEEFLNHMNKTFWLQSNWDSVLARGQDGAEDQVAAYGGGQSYTYIRQMANGLMVCDSANMPYHARNYTAKDYPTLSNAWNSNFWKIQKRHSDFNLDTDFLPNRALVSDKYYSINSFGLVKGNDIDELEKILGEGKEISWDMTGFFPGQMRIWDTISKSSCPTCKRDSHGMLIIGFDKRDPDPKKHYFIIKNSWGRNNKWPDGFTRVTYAYVKAYGVKGAYINSINPPVRWPALGFVGRWDFSLDGGNGGILDVYHVAHVSEMLLRDAGVRIQDLRLGTYYAPGGKAYKVNGYSDGLTLHLFINFNNPNVKYDDTSGNPFHFTLMEDKGNIMAGTYKGLDGRTYGGFAKRQGVTLDTATALNGAIKPPSYKGNWIFEYNNSRSMLVVNQPDAAASHGNYDTYTAVFYQPGGPTQGYPAHFSVEKVNPLHVKVESAAFPSGNSDAYLLLNAKGMIAGNTRNTSGSEYGLLMFRRVPVDASN